MLARDRSQKLQTHNDRLRFFLPPATSTVMSTPLLIGIGAIGAAVAGRAILRRAGQRGAEQWVKGGFKAKMDRTEAIATLGLRCFVN